MNAPVRRGFSLVEAMVALALSGVLVAASGSALFGAMRRATRERLARAVRHNVRTAALVLAAELRDVSPGSGDLVVVSDSAVTIRAIRSFSIVCMVRSPNAVVVSDSLTFALRGLDASRDSVLLYREGDALRSDDDGWLAGAAVGVGADRCPSGEAGTRVTLGGVDLAGVASGAPLRSFEIQDYRLYRDGAGQWWLGVRAPEPTGWSATSPIAGPLVPRVGIRIRPLTAGGAAASPGEARLLEVVVRGAVGSGGTGEDTALARVPLRND